ncbi:MAG: biosynthetic-type acetolactate synthase large subunit [Eubacterium sp.]|jgi:acetolactate synthase-1/2/3 large subunit|nr:biosynthetic-type acetolactate synthase large subunit [Eubacterium sp.]
MRKEKITVAKAIVKCLEIEGIKTVFGYPGAAICPFYDELHGSDVEHILVRQESNGGHAANGYARVTGKPAVCVATSGPGATNLITAIATAYMDSIPIVCITGQVSSELIGRDVFQEADITGAAEPFVKHSFLVKESETVCETIKKAFYIAGTGRPGPVLIDVPFDVQKQEIEFLYPENVEIRSYRPTMEGNKRQIKLVADAIATAKKPLICAGGGIFASCAQEQLRKLTELCDIPVISTMMGISALTAGHPMFFGMIGMHGFNSANTAVAECDLLILLGARVGDRAISSNENLKRVRVVHVDIDPAEIGKNLDVSYPVVGDLKTILNQILEIAESKNNGPWISYLSEIREDERKRRNTPEALSAKSGKINPKAFILKLNQYLPENTVISADVGQNQIWSANHIKLNGGRFITSGGMGTMGYSVPAAIGAKKADPEALVIAVCGDGSFQMQFMELATMVQHGINVKIIIMVNLRLGMVRELQSTHYDNRQIAVFLDGSPDFIKIGEAYGIAGETVNDIQNADRAIERLIKSEKPYILQLIIDEEERTII